METLRTDHKIIASLIHKGAKVLDLGCGDGMLLKKLHSLKDASIQGVEIDTEKIKECSRVGVPVIHGDIDEGLSDYPDKSYDFVICSQTLQAVHKPREVLNEMLRVGRKGIVILPNFGHWRIRKMLFFGGRMPKSNELPYDWFNSPNIRHLTIKDFKEFCAKEGIRIEKEYYFKSLDREKPGFLANILCRYGMFVISR